MLRVTTLRAAGTAVANMIDYYAGLAEDQQRRDGTSRGPVDYYLDPDEPPGRWWGGGCHAVGLAGEVEADQLRTMLEARHPGTGRKLGRGFGDRSARGFDATFSAAKSVSVLWALSPDPWVRAEVLAAHDAAVTAALGWLEEVRRFAEAWEAEASLLLRAGDVRAMEAYAARRRREAGGWPRPPRPRRSGGPPRASRGRR